MYPIHFLGGIDSVLVLSSNILHVPAVGQMPKLALGLQN